MTEIKCIPTGELQTNCYIVTDTQSGLAAVVDPGVFSKTLSEEISGIKIEYILLTHGHYDHIGGVNDLAKATGAKVVIGEKEKAFLSDPRLNLSEGFCYRPIKNVKADITLCDKESVTLGNTKITFIETPGHTAGGGCYIFDDCIMSGDTLFCESIGRTDFPTGSYPDIVRSLQKLRGLCDDYKIFPGHGPSTTLRQEIAANPYMKDNGYEDIY